MKKNTLQKLLSVALVAAMTATMFAGCGDKTDSPAADNAEPTVDENVVAGMDGWTAFENQVTLKIPVYDRGDNGNGCSDVVNNYWTNWVQSEFGDKWNINVEYVAITRSDVMTDYGLLASTQSLPTICMEYDYDKLATWATEGYLQTYDTATLAQVAPTYWNAMVANGLDSYTDIDGQTYIALGQRPYGNTTYTFVTFYRQDWLEEAGLTEYPQTQSELNDLYAKLVANGHAAPLGGSKATGAGIDQNYGYRDYPQNEELWCSTGDYQIPALSTEAQKRFLKLQNYLYNNGYMNKEYSLREAADHNADFINGKVFTYTGYISSNMDDLNAFYEKNPDAKLGVVKCSGTFTQDATWGSSNSYRPNNVFGAMAGFSSTASADEVKAAMMYMEWMSQADVLETMQYGIEGVNYDVVDGAKVMRDQTGLPEQQGHNNNVDYWMIVYASKTAGSVEQDIAAVAPQGLPQDFTQDIIDNYYGQVKLWEAGYANSDCLFGASIEAVVDNSQGLVEKYCEYRDKLVMCPEDQFDALYDELSKQYLEAGYQAVIDGRLDLLNQGLTTRL